MILSWFSRVTLFIRLIPRAVVINDINITHLSFPYIYQTLTIMNLAFADKGTNLLGSEQLKQHSES